MIRVFSSVTTHIKKNTTSSTLLRKLERKRALKAVEEARRMNNEEKVYKQHIIDYFFPC